MNLEWRSDGTTEVEGGLNLPVEDASVRAKGDNRQIKGKNQRSHSRMFGVRITDPLLQG